MIFIQTHWQEIVGAAFGFLYLYLEYKADIKMWAVGFVTSCFYIWVFVEAQFYAYAAINVYYLFADMYGLYTWRRRKDEAFVISRVPRKLVAPLAVTVPVLTAVIYLLLRKFGNTPVAFGDSVITALSIVAIYMLMQKYVEQWLLLIVANVISVVLFWRQGLYPTVVLYAAFAVGSVLGYFKWRKEAPGLSQKNANFADYANFRKYYMKIKFYITGNKQNNICEDLRNLRNLRSKKLLRQPPDAPAAVRLLPPSGGGGACILADGEFPKNAVPLDILRNAEYLVCCDGAADKLVLYTDRVPDAIVGDCDSLSAENKARFAPIVHRITEQETNDLTKAVHFCKAQARIANPRQRCDIVILGATGRREDHTLGNISLLAEYIDIEGISVSMATDYGVFTAIKETTTFESRAGQQISVFDIGRTPATFHRLKYPVENRVLANWWQGTLNEATEDSFMIETWGKMIVFREW